MKALCLLAVLVLGGSWATERPKSDPHATTLRLEFSDGGLCSGTAVGRHTVLTATHCLEGGAVLRNINGKVASIARQEDDGKDHSLLVVSLAFEQFAQIGGVLGQGDQVEYWGNPSGLSDQYRRGVVSGYGQGVVLIDANGWKGDSGAGVFKAGKVVTVVSGLFERESFGLMVVTTLEFTPKQMAIIK